jgi:1-acyl-sn-glycerol-3-phosphate acyltransferase
MARVILGIRFEVSGIERIEKRKAYIFMSNHLSIIDGPLLFMLIPRELRPFKRGGFFLALNSQVDIFPVTIKGTYEMMPRGSFFIKKGKVRVAFHPPVSVEGFDRQHLSLLVDKVRDIIKTGLDE